MREYIYIDMENQEKSKIDTTATITVGADTKKEEVRKEEPAKKEEPVKTQK